jgi:ubiquinone/menaquinone biosynthesis C-methylase UbiE
MIFHSALNIFFSLLYNQFAFSYDLVAAIVSLGKWQNWCRQVLPYISGQTVLEIGHGPGHLHKSLSQAGFIAFGLDKSAQMGFLALRNLHRSTIGDGDTREFPNLVRGRAEQIPFADNSFHTIVATFPTEYIFQETTILEIQRLLKTDGKVIVLLAVWITGTTCLEKLLAGIYRLTGQTPSPNANLNKLCEPYNAAGFSSELHWIVLESSRLLLLSATNSQGHKIA